MAETKRLNTILAILAIAILAGSCATFAYTLVPKGDSDKVVVNGVDYAWDDIFANFQHTNFTANGIQYEGVRLSEIINDTGIAAPSSHDYKITGSDDYTKTISWANMENGFIVIEEKKVVFPGLTRSFWVKDVITIDAV